MYNPICLTNQPLRSSMLATLADLGSTVPRFMFRYNRLLMFFAGEHIVSDSLCDESEATVRALMTETSPATPNINIRYCGSIFTPWHTAYVLFPVEPGPACCSLSRACAGEHLGHVRSRGRCERWRNWEKCAWKATLALKNSWCKLMPNKMKVRMGNSISLHQR